MQTNTPTLQQKEITDLIEEALFRRVQKTIQQYADKNAAAFQANKIAGIEWNLQMNVLVDNLGLNPTSSQIPSTSVFKRFINAIQNLFRKTGENPKTS